MDFEFMWLIPSHRGTRIGFALHASCTNADQIWTRLTSDRTTTTIRFDQSRSLRFPVATVKSKLEPFVWSLLFPDDKIITPSSSCDHAVYVNAKIGVPADASCLRWAVLPLSRQTRADISPFCTDYYEMCP